MQNRKAFSFVEVIIVVSIIILLGVVGVSLNNSSQEKTHNTKAIGDIETLNNSFTQYLQEKKNLPNPRGNINYFGSGSEYIHVDSGDEDNTSVSYGKHGFITENILPKQYLNYLPLDPRTNQYYAYGKTTDNSFYEVAGVLNIDGSNTAKVKGNYPGEDGPYNLIREYNGPNFVSNSSTSSFPYNPDERLLVARIESFAGTVNISNTAGTYTINNAQQILTHTITQGDIITVGTGGLANIYYSDGSKSTLGDTTSNSTLSFATIEFSGEENLLTQIQLVLDVGTLWTKATSLNSEGSEFEVYTQDTAASVRGTIFGIKKTPGNTVIKVDDGEVDLQSIILPTGVELIDSIQKETLTTTPISTVQAGQTIDKIGNTITDPSIIPADDTTSETLNTTDQIQFEEVDINTHDPLAPFKISFKIEKKHKDAKIILIRNFPSPTVPANLYSSPLLRNWIDANNILTLTGGTVFTERVDENQGNTTPVVDPKGNITLPDGDGGGGGTEWDLKDIASYGEVKISLCKRVNQQIDCIASKNFKIPSSGKLKYTRPNNTLALVNTPFDGGTNPTAKEPPLAGGAAGGNCYPPAPPYPNVDSTTVVEGVILTPNTPWQNGDSNEACYFQCNPTHTGATCSDTVSLFCSADNVDGYLLPEKDFNQTTTVTKNNRNLFAYDSPTTVTGEQYDRAIFKCLTDGSFTIIGTEQLAQVDCGGNSKFKIGGETFCEPKVDGKTLYAFAPYDEAGDIALYKADGLSSLNPSQNSIKYLCPGRTSGKRQGRRDNSEQCYFFTGGGSDGWKNMFGFIGDSELNTYLSTVNQNIPNYGLVPFTNVSTSETVKIGIDNSYFNYSGGGINTRGIFIDNYSPFYPPAKDYIKYSGLSLGEDFVIEMSVRGKELKRTDNYYSLLEIGGEKLYLYKDYPEVGKSSLGFSSNINPDSTILIDPNTIIDNNFYKITIIFDKQNNTSTILFNGDNTDSITLAPSSYLNINIGSNGGQAYQWNGLIDYVKMYSD